MKITSLHLKGLGLLHMHWEHTVCRRNRLPVWNPTDSIAAVQFEKIQHCDWFHWSYVLSCRPTGKTKRAKQSWLAGVPYFALGCCDIGICYLWLLSNGLNNHFRCYLGLINLVSHQLPGHILYQWIHRMNQAFKITVWVSSQRWCVLINASQWVVCFG